MTADEGGRSAPDEEPPATGPPSTPPSTPPSEPPEDGSTPATGSAERTDADDADDALGDDGTSGTDGTGPPTRRNGGGTSRPPDPVPGRDRESVVRRLWTAETGPLFFLRELGTSAGAVVLVGLLLFGISGVWPPMVAVESGSMEPHMHKGDLVFITAPNRYVSDAAYGDTGVVTAEAGAEVGYRSFGEPGSVVVYDEPGQGGPPIIHRAEFYVEAGENWYAKADPAFVNADNCRELRNCPAPHAGFVTKGDANGQYDQASGIAAPVKPAWITGIARLRIPYLGWVRLGLADVVRGRHSGAIVGTAGPTLESGPDAVFLAGDARGANPTTAPGGDATANTSVATARALPTYPGSESVGRAPRRIETAGVTAP
jgi:signal peptidase